MPEQELPVWAEREQPTTYVIDVHEPGRDYAQLPPDDAGANDDYLAWINGYKEPLHDALRQAHPPTVERLAVRGIDLAGIVSTVAQIVDRPAYPIERIVTAHDLRAQPVYCEAAQDGFFDKAMRFGESGIAYAQFEYILHFVRLRTAYIQRAPKLDVVDTVAHDVAHATLAHNTYVHLDRRETGNKVYHWFGYTWRYADKYYGELMDEASSAKAAAEARKELGLTALGEAHPLVEPYREKRGFAYASVGAVALDVINQSAGHTDTFGIYRPLWDFMYNTQDEAARNELAAIVRRATGSALRLEEIEAEPYSTRGMSIATLQKVEEQCGVDVSQRPSKILKQATIY
jgi:hypothetical protein